MTAKHQQDTSSFGEFVASLKAGGDGKLQANRFRDRKGNSAHTNFPQRHRGGYPSRASRDAAAAQTEATGSSTYDGPHVRGVCKSLDQNELGFSRRPTREGGMLAYGSIGGGGCSGGVLDLCSLLARCSWWGNPVSLPACRRRTGRRAGSNAYRLQTECKQFRPWARRR